MEKPLPAIPAKRYFTIGEVGDLCRVKPHVLRYWEQEFTQLRPMKRRGNRRYYQHHEVLMIRRIRELLYEQGFTISGARNRLQELAHEERERLQNGEVPLDGIEPYTYLESRALNGDGEEAIDQGAEWSGFNLALLRVELRDIREMLQLADSSSSANV